MRNLAPFVAPSCGTWRPFVFPVVIVDVVVVVVVVFLLVLVLVVFAFVVVARLSDFCFLLA